MFAHASPSPPSTNTAAATPAPSRPSRLRGLSYLRNYTQSHLSLISSHPLSPGSGRLPRSANTSPSAPLSTSLNQSESYFPPFSGTGSITSFNANWPSVLEDPSSPDSLPPARGNDSPNMPRGRVRSSQTVPGMPQRPDSRRGRAIGPSLTPSGGSRARGASRSVEPKAPEYSGLAGLPIDQMPTIRFIPHQDLRATKPSLAFTATSRTLPHEDCVIRVGRYSERDVNTNPPPNVPSAAPVGFKSKVVSRRHCEFWCSQGQWYIKDVKSSSGTFLNHIRLSQPSVESRPFPVNDGDVVQLGIDFRGGEEQIFRCVKIRIECNRAWQKGLNSFNMSTHKRLRALNTSKKDTDTTSVHSSECSICLMSIAPCQSLFVAPCSHVWHFKCIRPILNDHKSYPQFLCPNCRAVADLEADVDDPLEVWDDDGEDSPVSEAALENGIETTIPRPETSHTAADSNEEDEMPIAISASLARDSSANEASSPPATDNQSSRFRNHTPINAAGTDNETSLEWTQEINVSIANSLGPSPSEDQRFALRDPRENGEGPLTPRNNVGPFIFNGTGTDHTESPQIASLSLD